MEILSTASVENTKNKTIVTFPNEVYGEEKDVKEIVVFLLLGIFIIFVNATSLVVFWRRRFFLRRSTILLINLTTADLLVGFVLIFTMLEDILPSHFVNGDAYFEFIVAFDVFATPCSIFFLAAISLEKAHAVLRPLRHVSMPTHYYITGVLSVWFLSSFLSAINLLPFHIMFNKQIPIIVISAFIGLALLITFASYASIWIKLKKRFFKPRTSATEMNKNLVKTLFIVTVLPLISWLPFEIIFILFHLLAYVQISNSIIVITRLVQYANSLLNPIVYNLRMPDFRREMKKLLCGCVLKDIPKSNIRLVSMKVVANTKDLYIFFFEH